MNVTVEKCDWALKLCDTTLKDVVRHPYLDRLRCKFREVFLNGTRRRGFQPIFSARSDREDWIQSLIQKNAGGFHRSRKMGLFVRYPKNQAERPQAVFAAIALGREDTVEVQHFLNSLRSYSW